MPDKLDRKPMSDHATTASTLSHQATRHDSLSAENMTARIHSASPALPSIHQLRDRSIDQSYSLGPVLPPPRPSSQASTDSDQRSTRTLASVHSILNPSASDEPDYRGRRRSAAQMEGELPYNASSIHDVPIHRPDSSMGRQSESSPPNFQGSRGSGMPRRILTPISPTLHRATSLNRIVTPGTIDARGTPFLSNVSSVHTAEPGTAGVPPLPPLTGQTTQRQSFSYSQGPAPNAPPPGVRRKSVSTMSIGPANNNSRAPSARASPSPSTYSSYSRSGQASPTYPYPPSTGPTPPGSYSLGPSPGPGSVPTTSLEGESGHTIPMVSAGQNAYELVSINTARGMVSLPVEVHVASRQADEKRKRNAGASARFRQRRKEKEREANTTIDKLRDQLRYAQQDSEYYKHERDRYLNIIKSTPGWERYLPRSPSPAAKRGSVDARDMSTEGMTPSSPQSATSSEQHQQQPQRRPAAENDRNTRRRTEAYSLSLPSPTSMQPGQHYPSPFPPYSPSASAPPPGQQQQHHHPPYSPSAATTAGGDTRRDSQRPPPPPQLHPQQASVDVSRGPKPSYNPSSWSLQNAPTSRA